MDIRIVGDSIFDINSDCIVYFVDNAFTNKDSMDLISNAGDRILNIFSNLSSISTYDFQIIPAFNIKSTYICLITVPNVIETEDDEARILELFDKMYTEFKNRNFTKISFDIKRLECSYGIKHCELLKKFLRKIDSCKEDIVVFMCK